MATRSNIRGGTFLYCFAGAALDGVSSSVAAVLDQRATGRGSDCAGRCGQGGGVR